MGLLAAGAFGHLPWSLVIGSNLVLAVIGGGLRFIAHAQKTFGWVYADGLGKLLAYLGTIVVLFVGWQAR